MSKKKKKHSEIKLKKKMTDPSPFGGEAEEIDIYDIGKSSKKKKHALKAKKKKKRLEQDNPFDKKKKKSGKKKAKQSCWWASPLAAVCVLALGFVALYCVNTAFDYEQFKARKAAVQSETFYDGILVENYDLSGKTVEYALDYWDKWIEQPLRDVSVVFDLGETAQCISCAELGYTSNYESVLLNAWANGRDGSFEERYRSLAQLKSTSSKHEVTRTRYDRAALRAYTDEIAKEYTIAPENAQLTDFDFDTHEFTLTASKTGYYVDADALFEEAVSALDNGGGRVVVKIEAVEPEVRSEDINGAFGMITQAKTNASSSSNSRITNLKLACESINGTVVMPGETFSYNDTVGQRTKAKGYKIATVYQAGEVAEDIGGGICQVSTTLWNAAMKADCEIVERHPHSRPVSYVDKGKDATVSWGSQDMKFKNTSDYPMYIVAYVSSDKRVYCEIYGKLFDDGMYITIESKLNKTIDPGEPARVYNPALAKGQTVVVTDPRKGYKATAYRVYHAADGKELSRVVLCTSYYKENAGKIEYGG